MTFDLWECDCSHCAPPPTEQDDDEQAISLIAAGPPPLDEVTPPDDDQADWVYITNADGQPLFRFRPIPGDI